MPLSVQEILNSNLATPAFAYRPSISSPIRGDMSFTRSSDAWVFTPQQNFVKKGSGVPRIRGENAGILVETQSDQRLNSPGDLSSSWDVEQATINAAAGTVLGQSYGEVRETTADNVHSIGDTNWSSSTGADIHVGLVFRKIGRNYFSVQVSSRDANDNNNNVGSPEINLDASASDPKDWSASIANNGQSTIHYATVEKLWREWGYLKFGFTYNSGIYGYNFDLSFKQDSSTKTYPGDTSKGVDVLVGNIIDGRVQEADPIFQHGVQNNDNPEFSIPTDLWNNKEGAYYMEFTPRISHGENFSRIFNSGSAEIYLSQQAAPFGVQAFDKINDNQSVGVTDAVNAYERNRLLVTFRDDGDWAICANGSDTLEENGQDGAFLTRPNPGGFTRSGHPVSMVLHDFRYIPSWVPKTTRIVATS